MDDRAPALSLDEASAPTGWRWLEHLTIVAALLWWAWPLTTRAGGRGAGALPVGVVIGLAAFVVQRPWRRLPLVALTLATAIAVAALLVCFLTPVGFARADSAVTYVYAVGLAVTAWCYARTPRRRELVVAAILFAGMREFAGAFFAWWGHGTSAVPMTGDFPWRNSYAGFLVAPAVLGAAVAVRNTGAIRLFGWVAAPLCLAGVVFSTSRAAIAAVLTGWFLLGLLALRRPTRGRLIRWFAVGVAGLGFVYLLAGPPVFAHRTSPFTAIQQRTAGGETLTANGNYRLEFWGEAVDAFRSRPLTGTGYQEFAAASYGRVPASWPRTPLAHNSYLQPLADGGLLLAVPFLLAVLAAGTALEAGLLRNLVKGDFDDLVWPAAGVGLFLAMGHAAVDFDWTQPSNLAMAGLLGAVVFAKPGRRPARRGPKRRLLTGALAAAFALLLGFSAYAVHHWDGVNELSAQRVTTANAAHRVAVADSRLRDYRPAQQVLWAYINGTPIDASVVRRAVDLTASIGALDRTITLDRATALGRLGDHAAAINLTESALASLRDSAPDYWIQAGRAFMAAGERERGRAMLWQAADRAALRNLPFMYWAAVHALVESDQAGVPRAEACAVSAGIDRFGGKPSDPAYAGMSHLPGCSPLPPAEH
ncbi:MAG: O-antigen ligase family protein [Actinomycetes bacterium]